MVFKLWNKSGRGTPRRCSNSRIIYRFILLFAGWSGILPAIFIIYAKTETEALAESFYCVVQKQMEGKQSHHVLALRSKLDSCLPPVLQCDVALTEMAHLYIGNKRHGLKKHYVPVYRDKRSIKNRFTDCSKVVDGIKKTPAKFLYLI